MRNHWPVRRTDIATDEAAHEQPTCYSRRRSGLSKGEGKTGRAMPPVEGGLCASMFFVGEYKTGASTPLPAVASVGMTNQKVEDLNGNYLSG
jgi:hypothetical protein